MDHRTTKNYNEIAKKEHDLTYGVKKVSNYVSDGQGNLVRDSALDFTTMAALGRVSGVTTWNKFGYNEDVDTTTDPEVIAEFGGVFNQKIDNAELLDIVSTSTEDDAAGTGVRTLVIFGVGGSAAGDRNIITDVVTMDGTTSVSSNLRFWGINRMTIFQSGTAGSNVGTITATAATSGNTMASMPTEEGTTQQMIFYVPENYQFLATWLDLNALKISGGGNPKVTFKGWVYSEVVDSTFEVYRGSINTVDTQELQLTPGEPFVVGEKSILWFTAETDTNNAPVRGRFSGKLIADAL